ncbi:odorant receptor 4-like isoform X2 [Temnothorax longispinosus]|uniref:odorant receptor 4-like isoform X2 n=1 Tax=Temnothorax longispinosus TaxID=300112 RepID=UPI003A997763
MIHLEARYYSLNRLLLLAVGLWPYQQSKFTQFQFIFFSATLSAGIIFQLTPLIVLKCTSDLVTKVLFSASFFTTFIITYNAFRLNIEVVKKLLMELQHILNELRDKNEIAIAEKYSCIANRYTIALAALGVCGIFVSIIVQFWSNLINVDVPMNISHQRSRHLFIITEYFVDQEMYFYLILFHVYVAFSIGATVMVGIGAMLITYLQHTCGMFRIASYRIEHAMGIDILQNITLKNKILMIEGIIYAVDIHRLSRHLLSAFEILMFCLITCGVVCVSINLFQIASSGNNVKEFLFPFLLVFACVTYMFIANYIGQIISDHNNHVFSTAYNVQWYRAPIHIQKMILFLLQRQTKEFTLSVGKLFHASMECFATLVKTSVSYFTVIYSTR